MTTRPVDLSADQPPPATVPGSPLTLQTLGVPRVWVAGAACPLSGKSLALLVYLALEGPAHRDLLTELLWTEKAGQGARGNLRQELYRLRGKLPDGWLKLEGDWAEVRSPQVDVLQLRAHLAAGRWEAAAERVGGEFLVGLTPPAAEGFGEWREQQAAQWRAESLRALSGWAAELERRGEYRAALAVHERGCALDDFSETHQQGIIRLRLVLGEREAALQQAREFTALLHRELGTAPSQAVQALTELAQTPPPDAPLPLSGREDALYALSHAHLALILGEAGTGKTRLCAAAVPRPGLTLRGLADLSSMPYAPLAEALSAHPTRWPPPGSLARSALLRLLPGEDAGSAPPLPEDRVLFVRLLGEALGSVLGGDTLVIEDLHWLDSGTLDVVAHHIRHHTGKPAAGRIVMTARSEALRARTDLQALLDALAREHTLTRVHISELSEPQVRRLVEQMIGHDAPLFSQRLYRATAGHPLFILETLRDLRERGELRQIAGLWQTPYDDSTVDYAEIVTPPSVQAAIHERLARLGEGSRRALQAAALSREALNAAQIAEVSGLSEWDTVEALEQAQAARLITLLSGTYSFGHELYRRATAESVQGARRQTLHRFLARMLDHSGAQPARVAEHLEEALEHRAAWPKWREASQRAAQLFAYQEASGYLHRALACQPPDTDAFELLIEQAELLRHADDQVGRLDVLERLRALADVLGDPERQADAAVRFASYCTEQDDYAGAVQTALMTLNAVQGVLSPAGQAALLLEAGAALACQDRHAEALTRLAQALVLTPSAPPHQFNARHGNILYWMGHCAAQQGDIRAAVQHYRSALLSLPPSRLTRGRVLTLWKLGQLETQLEEWSAALEHLSLAEHESRTLDSPPLRLLCLTALAEWSLAQNHTQEALRLASTAQHLIVRHHDSEGREALDALFIRLQARGLTPT
ncbi:ATP-binding protein [Deinococcus alpinitundrae]|uniref:ATP-binding protein n=1 Tax=Deinococcus alpinitundrae TaxID=468913 RepID=UPI001379F5EE|nr:AAA family ATPase [Deinococcus alpinitundrae]